MSVAIAKQTDAILKIENLLAPYNIADIISAVANLVGERGVDAEIDALKATKLSRRLFALNSVLHRHAERIAVDDEMMDLTVEPPR
jgi:hypothetical protein